MALYLTPSLLAELDLRAGPWTRERSRSAWIAGAIRQRLQRDLDGNSEYGR